MNTRALWIVASWEFRRCFKWKEQLVGLVLLLAGAFSSFFLVKWVEGREASEVALGVVGETGVEGSLQAARFVLHEEPDAERARAKVLGGELEGWIAADGSGAFHLETRREVPWRGRLEEALSVGVQPERLAQVGLDTPGFAALLAPVPLEVRLLDPEARTTGRADKVAALLAVFLVLGGVVTGNAYLMMGITGEKQLRVTEQVLAAISPQTWIDGKVLGLAAMTLTSLALYTVGGTLALLAGRLVGFVVPMPASAADPVLVLGLFVIALLGFGFWFSLFAAVAATIDDPNHSARGIWMLLPGLPLAAAFGVFRDPESTAAVVLGLLPPTAPAVLPVRLVLGAAGPLEVLAAAVLLVLSILALRRAAGRVFALGIEMRGKEPTWGEMYRALRRSRS